jgi:hypothetical protein
MALAGETGELIDLFQWLTEDESRQLLLDPEKAQSVRDEIADLPRSARQCVGRGPQRSRDAKDS